MRRLDIRPPIEDFDALVAALSQPGTLIEVALVAGCFALAWAVVRLARGAQRRPGSVWFGEHIVDGVLFPLVVLGLMVALRLAARGHLIDGAVLRIALPLVAALAVIRTAVRVLRVAFPNSAFVRVVERSVSWFIWIVFALWATGLLPSLLAELESIKWTLGGAQVSLRSLIEGALSAVVVLLIALWLSAAIEARLLAPTGGNLSLRMIAANAVRALLLLVGLLLAMSAAGIPLGALSVFGGALGVGIGFGLQKLAANYVSGFVILAERSLRIGDMVRVDGFEGRITEINTRYTVVRSLGGRESIVPNEMLITQRVENLTLADPKVLLTTTVQVAYGSDVPALIDDLTARVGRVPRVLDDPGPNVQLSAFASDGLELTVNFWVGDPDNGQGNVRSAVNLVLLQRLGELGVEIPFPQRVLHRAPRAPTEPQPAKPPLDR